MDVKDLKAYPSCSICFQREFTSFEQKKSSQCFLRLPVLVEAEAGLFGNTLAEDGGQFMYSIALLLLAKTSPRGPPIKAAQATGFLLICSTPGPSLKLTDSSFNFRERLLRFSWNGEEEQDDNSSRDFCTWLLISSEDMKLAFSRKQLVGRSRRESEEARKESGNGGSEDDLPYEAGSVEMGTKVSGVFRY